MDTAHSEFNIHKICVIGAGRVGGPLAALLAAAHPAIQVFVLDNDAARIAQWNSPHMPFYEPKLKATVCIGRDGTTGQQADGTEARPRDKNLTFTIEPSLALSCCDLVFLCLPNALSIFGLPPSERALSPAAVEKVARGDQVENTRSQNILKTARDNVIVVNRCTNMPGTTAALAAMIQRGWHRAECEVLSMPEFLRQGSALHDLLRPDRIVIGYDSVDVERRAVKVIRAVFYWVCESDVFETSTRAAELAKLATTAMLAQRLASINSLRDLCWSNQIELPELATLIGTDLRVGKEYLRPATGVGGPCLVQNLKRFVSAVEQVGDKEVAAYWKNIAGMGDYCVKELATRITDYFSNDLSDVSIGIFGLSYKPWAHDARCSPAREMLNHLIAYKPQQIEIADPEIVESIDYDPPLDEYGQFESASCPWLRMSITSRPYPVVAEEKNVIVIMTNHDLFRYPPMPPSEWDRTKETQLSWTEEQHKLDIYLKLWRNGIKPYTGNPCHPEDCRQCKTEDGRGEHKYAAVDWQIVADLMEPPRVIFDFGYVVDAAAMEELGFTVIQD